MSSYYVNPREAQYEGRVSTLVDLIPGFHEAVQKNDARGLLKAFDDAVPVLKQKQPILLDAWRHRFGRRLQFIRDCVNCGVM